MKYSPFQKAIFKFCKSGKGNAIVQAVAGSGKTTTAVKAMEYCDGSTIFLAFNKTIAEELVERGVNGKTFHSLCFSVVRRYFDNCQIDSDKLNKIMRKKLSIQESKNYGPLIRRLVGLGKQSGVGIFCGPEEFERLFLEHDMNLMTYDSSLYELFNLTNIIFNESIQDTQTLDFDDMLYFAVKENIKLPKYDFIFVDEVQDTNMIQRAILRQMMTKKTRMIAIGDRYQSIYKFRGADSNSMDLIKQEFNCIELPLSVSYRCAKKVVEYARQYSPIIESHDQAEDGTVNFLLQAKVKDLKKKDFVLCRTTAPLINAAYKCLNQGVPVQVLGRDIGKGLIALIERCNHRVMHGSTTDLLVNLEIHRNIEIDKFKKLNQESKIEAVNDKCDTIVNLCNSVNSVEELIKVIETLFKEKDNAVTFSTIHKSKGLEAKRVYWLNYDQCPPAWARKAEDKQQEINICYVAVTRAKSELNLTREFI